MKKIFSFFLCLLILVQMLPVFACASATDSTEAAPTETVPAAAPSTQTGVQTGMLPVLNGCRTFNAQVPLGGDARMLDTAVSAFVYERNTGTLVYAYNPDMKMQPGTFTKLVAAIVALENGNLDDKVTVNSMSYRSIPPGAVTAKPYLKEGEELTLRDLLHLMILTWANDATVTVAEHIGGNQENFVKMMNDWIKRAGCTDTTFLNCHGLGSTEQRTTARDLARIVEEATKNAEFREIFGANSYKVPATNKTEASRDLKALNYLKEETYMPNLVYKGVTGGIAHYSEVSGASLVCTAEKNNMSYTVVVLGCTRTFKSNGWSVETYGNYEEAWDLLDFAFDNYKHCRLLHEGQSMTQFAVVGGENQVVAQTHTSSDAILPVNAKLDNLILKYTVTDGGLTAPIEKDERIANLQVWYRNSCIADTDLYAMSTVRALATLDLDIQGAASRDDSNFKQFLSFVGIVCLVILIPLAIYLIVNNARRVMARNRRRRRKQQRRRSR